MEKINKELIKESKVSLNYLDFILDLKNSKIIIDNKNKEVIINKYNNIVNLKFSNIKRVDMRNKREEVIEKRNLYLKSINLDIKDFNKISKEVVLLSNSSNNNRYI